MAAKNIILKKKIGSEIFELMVKTIGAQVTTTFNGTTDDLDTILANVKSAIDAKAANSDFQALKTSFDNLVNGADTAYDTLKEIGTWIAEHKSEYDALLAVSANKVDKVEGKGLSSNDFTDELLEKLNALDTQAQATEKLNALSDRITTAQTQADKGVADAAAAKKAADTAVANATTAQSAAEAAQSAAEAAQSTADTAVANAATNANAITALQTKVAANARFIVSDTQPADLTEADVWAQEITV